MIPLAIAVALAPAPAVPNPSPGATGAVAVPTATPEMKTPSDDNGLVLPPVPAISPTVNAPKYLPSGDVVGVSGPFVGLTLADAIGMALSRNTDLSISQSNRRISGYQIVAAEGAYDLQLMIQPSFTYAKTPAVSGFQSGPGGSPPEQSTAGINAQLGAATGSGGQFSIGSSASRTNSNLTFNSYDPYYQTAFTLNYSQPLARNLSIDQTRRQIQLAKINADLSSDAALLAASNTVANVSNAFYDLVAAWRNVAIQEDALRQAKAQSESNARLVKRGAAAPVEVIESDTQVQIYQNNVYSAIQNVASLQNQIKQLVLGNPVDPAWTMDIVPVVTSIDVPAEPSIDDVLATALRGRPEVAQLRETISSADVNVLYYKNQTLPEINLNLGVGESGFAGAATPGNLNPFNATLAAQIMAIDELIARVNALTPGQPPLVPLPSFNQTLPPYTIGGLGQAYSNMFAGRYPQASVSVTLGFPLRNRTAEANYHVALEQRAALVTQEVALIQRLQVESRNALQAFRSARSRLIAAKAARRAAEAVEASEERKFRAGQSTTFLVLQRQVNLATQRGAELQADTDVQKALVELDRVTGNVLSRNGVVLETLGSATPPPVPLLSPAPGR